jgi:hypothetical protein
VKFPVHISEVYAAVSDLNPENRPQRALTIRRHEVLQIYHRDQTVDRCDEIRVEIVPEDQIGVPDAELLRVVQAVVGDIGLLEAVKMPFLLRRRPEMTIEQVREVVRRGFQIMEEDVARVRFVVKLSFGDLALIRFAQSAVLKNTDTIGAVVPKGNDTLIMIRSTDGLRTITGGGVVFKH